MNQDNQPIEVKAENIHGKTMSMREFGLFGAFCLVVGFFIGGVVQPYWSFDPKSQNDDAQIENEANALMLSIGALNVLAAPSKNTDPIETGLAVEQIISDYQVRANQNGLISNVEYAKTKNGIEARFSFKERKDVLTLKDNNFPKSLVFGFAPSNVGTSIILDYMRQDGKERTKGEIFVDLVAIGGNSPDLAAGQYLTKQGVFELKSTPMGAVAYIDENPVFPQKVQTKTGILSISNVKDEDVSLESNSQSLRLFAIEPNKALFVDRFILVSSEINGAPCTSQAIVIDVPRKKTEVLKYMLQSPSLKVANAKKSLILSGFCDTVDKSKIGVSNHLKNEWVANYNLQNGNISYDKRPIIDTPIVNNIDNSASLWKQSSPSRITSPIGNGDAFVSLSCRPGGGVSLSISGLPAPQDAKGVKVIFDGSEGSASAAMRYLASSNSYELAQMVRPEETRQVLRILRGNGEIIATGAGGRSKFAAAGANIVNSLQANCGGGANAQVNAKPVAKPKETAETVPQFVKVPPPKPLNPKTE